MAVHPDSIESDRRILRACSALELVASLLFLTLSVVGPSQEALTPVFGLSWLRMIIAIPIATGALLSSALLHRTARSRYTETMQGRFRAARRPALFLALFSMVAGAVVLVAEAMSAAPAISPHLQRLAPLAGWLVVSGFMLAIAVLAVARGEQRQDACAFAISLFILALGLVVHLHLQPKIESTTNDIYYTYEEGARLLHGENPYLRILEGDMRRNQKYATYLPLFYFLSAAVQWAGFYAFPQWIAVWRIGFLLGNLSIAASLFYAAHARGHTGLGGFASLLWLFNRWTLHVSFTGDLDFLPLSLLVLSMLLAGTRRRAALLVFGVSTALKHYSIFLAPVLLTEIWRRGSALPARRKIQDILLLGAVPAVTVIPFAISDANALVRSILFSATRDPEAIADLASVDGRLGWEGLAARLPMLAILGLTYWSSWRASLGRLTASLLIMSAVTFLNPVFFTSYMVWVIPFIPLAVLEAIPSRPPPTDEASSTRPGRPL